ncbi:hypothetical protein BH18ACT11_BH18ACT11_21230 [soil metagenome]
MSARKALGLGAISGLRSTSGPAFVSRAASRGGLDLSGTRLAFLGSPRLSKTLLVMALGEFVGDTLPTTPSRTALPPLLGRAASGGLVGAALFISEGRRAATGAALGSSAAVAAAFAGERLRALLVEKTKLPDPAVALAEDAVVLLVGSRSSRGVH